MLHMAHATLHVAVVGNSVARFNNFGVTRGFLEELRVRMPGTHVNVTYVNVAGGFEPDHLYYCGLSAPSLVNADLILKNASRRIRRDIDIARWQKQTIQYEVGIDLMQREWDVLAKRCPQGREDTCFAQKEVESCGGRSEIPKEKRREKNRRSHPRWRTWS